MSWNVLPADTRAHLYIINSTLKKQGLPQPQTELATVPIYKKQETDSRSYQDKSLLSTTHKILSNTIL
jgi:hypothetical protein